MAQLYKSLNAFLEQIGLTSCFNSGPTNSRIFFFQSPLVCAKLAKLNQSNDRHWLNVLRLERGGIYPHNSAVIDIEDKAKLCDDVVSAILIHFKNQLVLGDTA